MLVLLGSKRSPFSITIGIVICINQTNRSRNRSFLPSTYLVEVEVEVEEEVVVEVEVEVEEEVVVVVKGKTNIE